MARTPKKKIRYAVVGLGHIAQAAVLPAFQHARKNSELVALVSGDDKKLQKLGAKYKAKIQCHYSMYEELLDSGEVDAVYIATPNSYHQHFTEIAAKHKIHVLCEKPMSLTAEQCRSMIQATKDNNVKLMIAYRLHFEAANLRASELAQSGKIGELKVFNSVFTMQVRDRKNIRLDREMGGGTPYDIGIYCINAARYIFRDEPIEVFATSVNSGDPRFEEVDEITAAILRFPKERIATFTTSFGAASTSYYEIVGTEGRIRLEHAYDYAQEMELKITNKKQKTTSKLYPKRDQFGPELLYFSNCILNNEQPEPNGLEGLADVQIINTLMDSAEAGEALSIPQIHKKARPTSKQKITKPGISEPKPIHARSPSGA